MLQILIFAFLAIFAGAALTLLGYAAFRFLLPIIGFLVGLWIGGDLISASMGGGFLATTVGFMLGFILGLVLALIAYMVYYLAVVIFGISLGYALGAGFMLMLGFPSGILTFLAGAFVAILVGFAFMGLNLPKLYIMAITAFAGASAMIAGILALFGQIPPDQLGLAFVNTYIQDSWFWLIVWVIVGLFGLFFQYGLSEAVNSMVPKSYSYDYKPKKKGKKK